MIKFHKVNVCQFSAFSKTMAFGIHNPATSTAYLLNYENKNVLQK